MCVCVCVCILTHCTAPFVVQVLEKAFAKKKPKDDAKKAE